MPLPVGAVLVDRYRVHEILGQGGFGAVYRATDEHLGLDCAIKENLNLSPASERQFRHEARLLAMLRHAHLPRVTNHFISAGQQYLVMDFVEGEDLEQHLEQHGRQPEALVLRCMQQICSALQYLHGRRPPVIHRDIKPANIKITPSGQAILVDFGIAKAWTAGQTTATGAKGVTPGFAPPEQYDLGQTDPTSDVYALGATLYNLLTDHRPPDSVERLLGMVRLIPPEVLQSDLSPHVCGAILRSMEVRQEDRFPGIAEFAAALADRSYRYAPAMSVQEPPPAEQPTRRRWRIPLADSTQGLGQRVRARLPSWLAALGVLAVLAVILVGPATLLDAAGTVLGTRSDAIEPAGVLTPASFTRRMPTRVPATIQVPTAFSLLPQPSPTPTLPAVPVTVQNAGGWRLFASWQAGESDAPFAMTPQSNALLLVSRQGVDTFDLLSGARLDELQGFLVGREVLQLAQQGDLLLVQFADEILQYDLTTRNLAARIRFPGREMRISQDGATLAVLFNHVSLLDRRTGELLAALEQERSPADFVFSPDGRYLAVTHSTGVHLYDARSGQLVRALSGHGEPSAGLAFTSDGRRLASAGGDLWDPSTGELLAVFDSSTKQLAISPNGQILVGADGSVWRLEDGESLGAIPFSTPSAHRLHFSADGALLVRRTTGGVVELWAVDPHAVLAAATPQAPATLPIGEPITPLNLWRLAREAQLGQVSAARFDISPGWTTAAAWEGNRVTIISLISGQITYILASGGQVLDSTYLGDAFILVLNSRGQVERWEAASGQLRQTYPYAGHRIEASPAGGTFAVQEKYIQVVDALSGERLFNLGSAVPVQELYPEVMRPAGGFRPGFEPDSLGQDYAFTPDGEQLAIAFGSGVSLWELDGGRPIRQFSGHGPATGGLVFTPDGSRMASSSGDVWDAESGGRLVEFDLQASALALSPDGTLIAGSDGSLWDGDTGQYLGGLELQARQLWFTPNRRQLVLQLGQGEVLVYGIQPQARHVSPGRGGSEPVDLPPLSPASAAQVSLIGWWGEDALLQVRNQRDRAAPEARRFGAAVYRHLCPAPDGSRLAALDANGLDLLDPASGRLVDRFRQFMNPDRMLEIAFLGDQLLLLKREAGIERWDLARQQLLQRYDLQGEGLLASPDGQVFALQRGNRLQLIQAASGEVRAEITISPGPGSYQFSPNGSLLAVARGATAELWQTSSGQRAGILRSRGGPVYGLAFSGDGERLLAASGEIWQVAGGELLSTFVSSARRLAASPQQGVFVGDDGAIRSVQEGQRVATLVDLRAGAVQLLFRRDGRQIVWRTQDGRVYTFGVRDDPQTPPAVDEQALSAAQADELTLLAHVGRGRLQQALWSPDDRYLAVNTSQNAVVYEADTLRPIRSVLDATALAFDSQGRVLIGGAAPLQLVQVETGAVVRSLGPAGIQAAAFSPDGQTLAIAGRFREQASPDGLALVDLRSGLLRPLSLGRAGQGAPSELAFTPDGDRLVLSLPGLISIWDLDTGQQLRAPIHGNTDPARISPDGCLLAYYTDRFLIERLDTGGERLAINADGTPYFPTGLDIPSLRPVDYQFTQQGDLLVFYRRLHRRTFAEDLALVEWDLAASPIRPRVRLEGVLTLSDLTGEHAQDYANELPQRIPAFGLSPQQALFYSLTGDGVMRIWDARDGDILAASEADTLDRMAIGPDSQVVVTDAGAVMHVWDLGRMELRRSVTSQWEGEWLGFASASTLAVLHPQGSLSIVDLQTGAALDQFTLQGYSGPAYFAPAPDGRSYALMSRMSGRNQLQLFGMAPDRALLDLGRYPSPAGPAFSPGGERLAVARRDQVVVWDLQTGDIVQELQGLGGSVGPLAFTPDGSQLVAGSGEIWDLASGTLALSFDTGNPQQRVVSNGRLIVGEAGELWEVSSGRSLGALPGLRGPARNFGFTPDGRLLIWQMTDGVIEVWGVSPASGGGP